MSEKPGVMIYFDIARSVEKMSNEQAGALFKAILEYGETRWEPVIHEDLVYVWPLIQMRLNSDDQRYYKVSQKRRYSAYARWTKHHSQEVLPFDRWLVELDHPEEDDLLS